MSGFNIYLQLGFEHIADLQGYDHMLFIITLCALYKITQWKNVLILVTAFTIGHSVTLALSALNILTLPADLIELLIPMTIFATSIFNVVSRNDDVGDGAKKVSWNYALALGFGFIHGMGFSNYFKALLGAESNITGPLFAFNIGLEIGQVLIVVAFFVLYWILARLFSIRHRSWNLFVSGAGAGVAIIIIIEKLTQM